MSTFWTSVLHYIFAHNAEGMCLGHYDVGWEHMSDANVTKLVTERSD